MAYMRPYERTAMFKRQAFHVQTVDRLPTNTVTADQVVKVPVDWTKLSAIAISTATELVKVGGSLYVLKKVADAGAEIAVLAAKAKFK